MKERQVAYSLVRTFLPAKKVSKPNLISWRILLQSNKMQGTKTLNEVDGRTTTHLLFLSSLPVCWYFSR